MGRSVAVNFHNHGYSVVVYNRTEQKTKDFTQRNPQIHGAYSLADFVKQLSNPRKILLMLTAGPAIDATISNLSELLSAGDVLMDGGNSFFQDTERRFNDLSNGRIRYLGIGVSGGEEGALKGPCIMAGGSKDGYELVRTMLSDIAAHADGPCCELLGSGGAGHYVKMVHNGIEYAIIEIIAEAFDVLTRAGGLTVSQTHDVFKAWTAGELNSYLMEITAEVLAQKDVNTQLPLVSVVLDRAKQKGTGKWTSQNALDLGIPTPTIDAAVGARNMSALKSERVYAAKHLNHPVRPLKPTEQFITSLRDAVHASIIVSYAQGFHLMRSASQEYLYHIPLGEVARIWKGGCIVRARLLDDIKRAYETNSSLQNLMLDPDFLTIIQRVEGHWRELVGEVKNSGIPIPAINASLDYYDAYRSERLPANLVQTLRDRFGSHGYERIDKPGEYHTNWSN
jgi:6-phosphogluconate dehydrogenase